MKALRFGLVLIVTLSALLVLSNTAVARTHVSVGIGVGYPGFYGGWGYGGGWGHHRFHDSIFIGGYWPLYDPYPVYSPYYYPGPVYYGSPYYGPGYYVADPPPVVVERPMVIERQPVAVQPTDNSKSNEALFQTIREMKANFLNQLGSSEKARRLNAINNLAGFSFDDNVRLALENVLLTDTDPELRIAVINAFGQVKNAKALPALEKARVEDSSTDVRKAADQAIKNLQNN